MFFKTSNPSALAAWQKYQQGCQKVKDEAKRLEAVLNVACRSVFVSGISGFFLKGCALWMTNILFIATYGENRLRRMAGAARRAHHVFPKPCALPLTNLTVCGVNIRPSRMPEPMPCCSGWVLISRQSCLAL